MIALRVVRWMTLFVAMVTALFGMRLVPMGWVFPIALVGALWAAAAGHAFVICYWIRQKWWRNPIGIHLMCFMFGLTVILDVTIMDAVVTKFTGGYIPGRKELALMIWTLFPILFTWRLLVLLGVKKNGNTGH